MPIPTSGVSVTGVRPCERCGRELGGGDRRHGVGPGGSRLRPAFEHRGGERLGLRGESVEEHPLARLSPHEEAARVALGSHQLDPAAVAVREASAERDGCDGAAREAADELHALGIAGDRLVRADGRRDGVQPDELLPGQPAELIELVDAHVDEDPAAAAPERSRRRPLVPLPARDEGELAVLSGRDRVAELDELGHEAPPVADLERDPSLAGEADGLGGVLRSRTARLLAEQVDARGRQVADELDMAVGRRGDQRGVDCARVQELLDGGMGTEPRRRGLGTERLDRLDDGGDLDRRRGGERAKVHAAHPARTDDREAKPLPCHGATLPPPQSPTTMQTPRPYSGEVAVGAAGGEEKRMRIGVVLESFLDRPLEAVLDVLAATCPDATDLEVGAGGFAPAPHCDVALLIRDEPARRSWLAGIEERGFRVSALNVSGNPLNPDRAIGGRHDRELRDAVRLSALLGVDRVVAMAGCPAAVPGDRTAHFDAGGWLPYLAGVYERQWERDVRPYWEDVSSFAAAEHPSLLVCLELHPGSAAYNVETFERLARIGANIAANLDPSHLFWQQMDPLAIARHLGERVAHAHAKDVVFNAGPLGAQRAPGSPLDGDRRGCALDVRRCGTGPRRSVVARVPRRDRRLRRGDDLDRARGSSALRGGERRGGGLAPRPEPARADPVLAILGGAGAALAWTMTTIAAARGSRLVDSRSLLASVMTVGLVVAAPAAAISGVPAGLDGGSALWLAVAGVGNVAGLFLVYPAFRLGDLAFVAPLVSTEGAVAAVIAVLAGERIGGGAVTCLVAIAAGVVLATVSPVHRGRRRSDAQAALLAAASALAFGVALYATGRAGSSLGIAWAVLPPRVVGVAAIAIPLAIRRRWRLPRAALPYMLAGGICEVIGFASYTWGARHGLAVSAIISSQFAPLSAVVGYLVFRERLGRIQVAGLATIVCGVSALAALQG